ncbi:FMN-dependent NADH-azoreductase [Candidatus Cryosericum hinesii]|jgi:FMN-dependent NADH-azoreductase|uniref:FMN dependent NADH:quinone oxidoreductase n=1 Tax=Candidatus Cryosericum hinesii TaxID=2290915 RepID=A0A398DS55_9BACT|nr:FMN-dependent NADH-azoreductase [Candidatus Cryosericum hinesii]RIE13501.1 FMN-dependent NADH-azoreductase [Candidatus Cryosericum hinesii]RIE14187.1 FMN-dependent NADH-azoreductase [Candidatus Cryosericum hinesii]
MSKVLYIKANPKSDADSRTFTISESFIEAYKNLHPNDEIVIIDLYKENIDFLSTESVNMHKLAPGAYHDHPVLKYAYQFVEADKYVFAEPLWNLGIPAILKAYIDYISVTGITFTYTAEGPKGLCSNKKAINITSRGGSYSDGYMATLEMGDKYLRTILGFLGICDFTTIAAEELDVIGTDVEDVLNKAIQQAQQAAATF